MKEKRKLYIRCSCICPFHEEKTGSLIVFIKSGKYHCLSCGAQGNLSDLSDEIFDKISSQLEIKVGIDKK